jgi:hypothetical protein
MTVILPGTVVKENAIDAIGIDQEFTYTFPHHM